MKGRQIITAAVVLALLGGYYWFFEVKKKGDDDRQKKASETLLKGLSATGAAGMNIKGAAGSFSFIKEGTDWEVNGLPADNNAVDAVITRLATEKYDRTLDNVSLSDFGIGSGSFTLRAADGKEYSLLLGDTTPTGSNVYAAVPGNTSTVYLVSTQVKSDADQPLFFWRLKAAARVDEKKATKVVSTLKDKKFVVEKDASGNWQVVSPFKEPGKKERIESIFMNLKMSQAKGFSASKTVSSPEYISVFEGKEEKRVMFGEADAKNATRWVKSYLYSEAMEMPDSVYTSQPKADEVVDRRITRFDQALAANITVTYADRELSAVKKKGKNGADDWQITVSKNIKNEDKKSIYPSNTVSALSWLEYKERVTVAPGTDEKSVYGTVPGAKEMKVTGTDGAVLAHIIIGKAGNKEATMFVKNMIDGKMYTADRAFLAAVGLPGFTE